MPPRDPRSSPAGLSFERTYGIHLGWIQAFNAFGLLAVLAAGLGLMFVESYRTTFRILTSEHGPVELTTFSGFMIAAIVSARVSWSARARREAWWVALFYAAFGVFCFVCAMEEISWGQALFDFATPFGLQKVNEQGELNLHNMPGMMDMNDVFLLVFGLAGLVGVGLGRWPPLRKIAVPRPLAPMFAWIAALGALEVVIDVVIIQYSFDIIVGLLAEVLEMLGGLTCLVYVALNGRMLAREARGD